MKNIQFIKDLLEQQIIKDSLEGDTTILAEIISNLPDEEIVNWLSDENQELLK